MKRKLSETCVDLLVGIAIVGVITSIVGGIIMNHISGGWLQFILGDIFGCIVASVLVMNMDSTIEIAVELDEKEAVNYTRKKAALRYVFMIIAVVIALLFPNVFDTIGLLLGILALKLSAYLQPVTSKYITNKICSKGR